MKRIWVVLSGALVLTFGFQNCGKLSKPMESASNSSSAGSQVVLNADGTTTIIGQTPAAGVTVSKTLVSSSNNVVAKDKIELSSTLESTIGNLTYYWYKVPADADVALLKNSLAAGDSNSLTTLIGASKVSSLAETTSTLTFASIQMSDSANYCLAAFVGTKLVSFQSVKINVLEYIPLVQTFTVAGTATWRKPNRGTNATIECWGAGGSGATGGVGSGMFGPPRATGGGGGGGGGMSRATVALTALGATETMTIGKGGVGPRGGGDPSYIVNGVAPGSQAFLAAGTAGSATTFGNNLVSATGGQGAPLGGAGGVGGTGNVANGAGGASGGVVGGTGGLAGGGAGTAGVGGANGTTAPSGGFITMYIGFGGGWGQAGAGGGGGGGNGTGASAGGNGGDGKCVVTVN